MVNITISLTLYLYLLMIMIGARLRQVHQRLDNRGVGMRGRHKKKVLVSQCHGDRKALSHHLYQRDELLCAFMWTNLNRWKNRKKRKRELENIIYTAFMYSVKVCRLVVYCNHCVQNDGSTAPEQIVLLWMILLLVQNSICTKIMVNLSNEVTKSFRFEHHFFKPTTLLLMNIQHWIIIFFNASLAFSTLVCEIVIEWR